MMSDCFISTAIQGSNTPKEIKEDKKIISWPMMEIRCNRSSLDEHDQMGNLGNTPADMSKKPPYERGSNAEVEEHSQISHPNYGDYNTGCYHVCSWFTNLNVSLSKMIPY